MKRDVAVVLSVVMGLVSIGVLVLLIVTIRDWSSFVVGIAVLAFLASLRP